MGRVQGYITLLLAMAKIGHTRCLRGQNRVPFYFSVRHAPRTPSDWLRGLVRGLLLLSYINTHIVGSWGGLWWTCFLLCAVLYYCCIVPGTTSCCSTEWHRRRSPAVARSLARSPSFDPPPPLLLIIVLSSIGT